MSVFHVLRRTRQQEGQQGFTLIELMITLAVLVITITIAVPAWQGVVARNAVTSTAETLIASVNYARSEAVASGGSITLCPLNAAGDACMNSSRWSNGWAVVQGTQADARVSLGDDLLRLFDAAITVQADVTGVTFDDQGATPDSTWLLICDQSGGQGHRQLELTPIGRVLTETYGSDDQSC
ncbi:GspH/FimT family pseudopilin [Cobetia marina]|uniref:GspH/FimT family pseudopilin n=1 Tax=Cobetia marina TaxID=28258 RepID=UPI0025470384|nr:GspH/FimT family pseudopilin [Cobetia pacifica]MDI6005056.1 GspH/FimT family pseudopilin [Cobetia pacifica]